MNYNGMTVSERLYATDLFGAFGKAVVMKDRESLAEILRHVELDEMSVKLTIENYIPNNN